MTGPRRIGPVGLALGAGMALLLQGCVNARNTVGALTGTGTISPSGGNAQLGSSLFTINNIVRDDINPTGTLDVVGDGSGSLGNYCVGSNPSEPNTGPSSCQCVFTYTNPTTGATESQQVPTTYQETNLIKCDFNTIPSAVTTTQVKIFASTQNGYSNQLTFNLLSSGSNFDTTQISNFSQVHRYSCRDIIWLESYFNTDSTGGDKPIYDPVQSEDPENTYPLNFYTTNVGGTLSYYAGGVSTITAPTGWDCPANPLNPSAPYKNTIYSLTALSGAPSATAKIIAPTPQVGGGIDRETFYLANQASGVFTVPVNAYLAPGIYSTAIDPSTGQPLNGVPPLGYGASPTATTSPGYETCPDSSVTIPQGFHWVKVWLFRMALPQRLALRGAALEQIGDLACYPGMWQSASGGPATTIADCSGGYSLDSPPPAGSANALVERFMSDLVCVQPTGGGAPGSALASYSPAAGADSWFPEKKDPIYGCGGSIQPAPNPANVCSSYASTGVTGMPYDPAPQTVPIDPPNQLRYDFLFVVTPVTVNSADMRVSGGSIANQYTPYRYRVDTDCGVNDPDNAPAGLCLSNKALRNYGITFGDVSSAGDPAAGSGNVAFPVCALQPN